MKRKLNQKSLYQEGGAMSSTNSANNTGSLAQDIQSQMQLGVSPYMIYRDMLVSYLPADEISAAFQELGYSQDDVSDLYEQVVEMMNEEQQSSESTMQEAQFGGWVNAPNYYLPMDLGRKGDPLNAALFAGKAVMDLFGGKDRDGDGFKDGAWRDLGPKRKAFKNFKNQKLQSFIPDTTSDTIDDKVGPNINSDDYDPEFEVENYLKRAQDEERNRLYFNEPDFPVTSTTTSKSTTAPTTASTTASSQTPVNYSYLDPAISQMLDFESKSGGYDPSMGAYGLTNLGANRYMMGPNSLNINSPTFRTDLTERIKQDYAPSLSGFSQDAQPAMLDYAYNTGRDPRIYMLDAYLKGQGQSGLPNRGAYKDAMQDYTWTDKNLEQQFNTEYDKYKDAIGNLTGQDQLRLMNEGRKFYYNNINQVNGQPNPAAQATWLQRPFYQSGGALPMYQDGGDRVKLDAFVDRVEDNYYDIKTKEGFKSFVNDADEVALPMSQMPGYTEPTYGKYWGRNWKSKSGQTAPSGGGYYYMSPNDGVLTPDEYKMMTKPLRKNMQFFKDGGSLPKYQIKGEIPPDITGKTVGAPYVQRYWSYSSNPNNEPVLKAKVDKNYIHNPKKGGTRWVTKEEGNTPFQQYLIDFEDLGAMPYDTLIKNDPRLFEVGEWVDSKGNKHLPENYEKSPNSWGAPRTRHFLAGHLSEAFNKTYGHLDSKNPAYKNEPFYNMDPLDDKYLDLYLKFQGNPTQLQTDYVITPEEEKELRYKSKALKNGGQLPKYKIQGEVLPEVTVTPFDNVMPNMPQTFDTIAPDFSGFEDINKNNIPDYLERNDPAKNQMGTQGVQGSQLPPDPFDNVIPDMSNTFDNVQGDVSTDTTDEDLPMYNRNPFVEAFGKTSNALVSGANLANEIFQNKRARQAEQDFTYSTMADKIYGAYNERPGSRGMWDVNTGLAQPDNLDVGYAQMGMEMSPKLNMLRMFTGGGMVYNDMYMPEYQVGGEAQVDNQTLAALIAAGADIEIL